MTNSTSAQTGRRGSWLRKLLFLAIALLVLLVAAYFIATSSAFFKSVVLPRVGKALGGQVTVESASISPLSQVRLRQLNVQTTGTEPVFRAEEVRLRYSLFDIMRGTMKVDEATVISPVVQIIQNADGTSNLDPLLKREAKPSPPPPERPAAPAPQVDLKNFALKNATIRYIKQLKDGGREVAELTGVNVTLDQLKNGASGRLTTEAVFKFTRPTNDLFEARSVGNFEFTLGADLLPRTLRAKVDEEVLQAAGSMRELAGYRAVFTGELTPTEVREMVQRFYQGERFLGELKVTGPLDIAKREGRLKLEAASIDRNVLNLVGAPFGIDFGTTTVNSTIELELTRGGSVIGVSGKLNAAKFSLTQKGQTTPPLDLQLDCAVTVSASDKTAQVQTLTLNGMQNQRQLLRGSLARPMTLAWGGAGTSAGDAAFDFAITDFNFADWKPFLGDAVPSGRISVNLNVLSREGGSVLAFNGRINAAGLSLSQKGSTTPPVDLQIECSATANTTNKTARVQALTLEGLRNQKQFLQGKLAQPAAFSWAEPVGAVGDTAFELAVTDFDLADWKSLLGDAVSAGRLSLNLNVLSREGGSVLAFNGRINAVGLSLTQKGSTTPPVDLQIECSATANTTNKTARVQALTLEGLRNQKQFLQGRLAQPAAFSWAEPVAAVGDTAFELAVTDFDLADWKSLLGDAVSAGRLSLNLNVFSQQGGKQLKLAATSQIAGLVANLGGTPLTDAALALKLNAQVTDFKQVGLSDFRLDLKRQGQPALTVSGDAGWDGAAFRAQTQIEAVAARLFGNGPTTPLTAGVKLDGMFTNQVADLRQLQLVLSPTALAPKNELNITGQFDLSTSGKTKGRLTARAETLDLTSLYDTFTSKPTSTAAPAQTPPAAPANVEPEPLNLPLQLTAEVSLAKVFLREMIFQDCQMTAKVDGGKIAIDPCRFNLNGAPVSASLNLDLGIKGYSYALALNADRVPFEPIANSFSPANRGQYQGLILATAQIKGAGVTGASLQKSLSGHAGFTFTNANIQLIGPKTRKVLVPIATLLRVGEITQSPLNWLDARAEFGGGNIVLNRFIAQSAAFEAQSQGTIPIAEVLTNSPLNLPVEFALRRSLAEKSNLLPPGTPTNAQYAMLPRFVTIKGTLGEPKTDLNELALGGLLLKSGLGIAEKLGVKTDTKTGSVLQGVGSLLTGQTAPGTNQPGTNPPAASPVNLLDLFKKRQ